MRFCKINIQKRQGFNRLLINIECNSLIYKPMLYINLAKQLIDIFFQNLINQYFSFKTKTPPKNSPSNTIRNIFP